MHVLIYKFLSNPKYLFRPIRSRCVMLGFRSMFQLKPARKRGKKLLLLCTSASYGCVCISCMLCEAWDRFHHITKKYVNVVNVTAMKSALFFVNSTFCIGQLLGSLRQNRTCVTAIEITILMDCNQLPFFLLYNKLLVSFIVYCGWYTWCILIWNCAEKKWAKRNA